MMCLLPFLESTCQVKNVWCRIVLWRVCLVFSTAILNNPHLTVYFSLSLMLWIRHYMFCHSS